MEAKLNPIDDVDLTDSERAIFNVIKVTLQYPANPQVKGVKLADDMFFFCESVEEERGIGKILWDTWAVLVEIIYCIPPGHPWQVSLIQSLKSLRQRDVSISENDKKESVSWKDLPHLSACVREQWNDPTYTGEELEEEFSKWKNFNSFVARLTDTGFAPWLNLPIWQLRIALEEPVVARPAMECRLWVASEWILHCADPIYKDTKSTEQLDESTARALETGSLSEDVRPLSLERWAFWKKRFSEFAADSGCLKLDSVITGRMSDALKSMDAVEE